MAVQANTAGGTVVEMRGAAGMIWLQGRIFSVGSVAREIAAAVTCRDGATTWSVGVRRHGIPSVVVRILSDVVVTECVGIVSGYDAHGAGVLGVISNATSVWQHWTYVAMPPQAPPGPCSGGHAAHAA